MSRKHFKENQFYYCRKMLISNLRHRRASLPEIIIRSSGYKSSMRSTGNPHAWHTI